MTRRGTTPRYGEALIREAHAYYMAHDDSADQVGERVAEVIERLRGLAADGEHGVRMTQAKNMKALTIAIDIELMAAGPLIRDVRSYAEWEDQHSGRDNRQLPERPRRTLA